MQNLANPYTSLPYYPRLSFTTEPFIGSISYPPFSAFIFAIAYRVYLVLGEPSRFLYYFLLKQPVVISDALVAIVLARIILVTKGPHHARTGFLIWIYFPFAILVSGMWGALDPITLLFMLLAIYSLLVSKQMVSAVCLGLSIFLKTMPVICLPVILMQLGTGLRGKFRYAVISSIIPILGIIAPVLLLNWRFTGFLANLTFQTDIPRVGVTHGEMSFLGRILTTLQPEGLPFMLAGTLWIPVLLLGYAYLYRTKPSLVQSLLLIILTFSISRTFLSEQWALYPAALLLAMASPSSFRHFLGMLLTATAYLLVNSNWLVNFLNPVSVFHGWDHYFSLPSYVHAQQEILLIIGGIFFLEALLTITGRESIICELFTGRVRNLTTQLPERIRMWQARLR